MTDTKTGDYIAENVPPPGGTKPTKTKTDNKKDEQKDNPPKKDAEKTENKTENENRDKNGFPKPDFSAISNYYELVKYEYDSPPGWLTLTVKVKKETSPVTSNFSIHFLDEDGAEVIAVQPALGGWGHPGDVLHSKVAIPNANDMKKVKQVVLRR